MNLKDAETSEVVLHLSLTNNLFVLGIFLVDPSAAEGDRLSLSLKTEDST